MISNIWEKMSNLSGVRKIMNDIVFTLKKTSWNIINMSAWNPLVFKELEQLWKKHNKKILNSKEFWEIIWRYGVTKWYKPLIKALKVFFKEEFYQNITNENILVTTWSQSMFFYIVNTFAWKMPDGSFKKIFLPQSPDYTWYNSMWLDKDMFISIYPKPEKIWKHKYKYKLDLSNFPNKKDIWAIIFSRPCNPTWNIMTNKEVDEIYKFIDGTNIPIFVDWAYGNPIPNLVYTKMETKFYKNTIYVMSFSKAWLPWERIWVAIWNPKIIKYLENFHANLSIMSSKFWQALIASALSSWDLKKISSNIIKPKYKNKFKILNKYLKKYMPDNIPWYIHKIEWAMFAFLWFENLPISDNKLYELLKDKWVLFVPWNTFFNWINKNKNKHSRECLRMSITVEDKKIKNAIKILSEVIKEVYKK